MVGSCAATSGPAGEGPVTSPAVQSVGPMATPVEDGQQNLPAAAGDALAAALAAAREVQARRLPAAREEAEKIAEAAGYTLDQLRGSSRHCLVMEVRRIVARYLTEEYGLSSVEIGEILNRDHTTVLNLLSPKSQRSSRTA